MNRSIPKKDILIQCGSYFVRTIRMKDASERWAGWLSDPEAAHMLNSPAVKLAKDDVVKYLRSFDQRSHLLLGIFERSSSLQYRDHPTGYRLWIGGRADQYPHWRQGVSALTGIQAFNLGRNEKRRRRTPR
jgi:hypothetical protein